MVGCDLHQYHKMNEINSLKKNQHFNHRASGVPEPYVENRRHEQQDISTKDGAFLNDRYNFLNSKQPVNICKYDKIPHLS